MKKYDELVAEAQEHVNHLARGLPDVVAQKVRAGEVADPRISLVVRLTQAVQDLQNAQEIAVERVGHVAMISFPDGSVLDVVGRQANWTKKAEEQS